MRCLSFPDNLSELAQEIQDMEKRVTENGNKKKIERCRSYCMPGKDTESEENDLIFFLEQEESRHADDDGGGGDDDENTPQQHESRIPAFRNESKRRSFLPSYSDFSLEEETETDYDDMIGLQWSERSLPSESDSSLQDPEEELVVKAIVEKEDDPNLSACNNQTRKYMKEAAEACVLEILAILDGGTAVLDSGGTNLSSNNEKTAAASASDTDENKNPKTTVMHSPVSVISSTLLGERKHQEEDQQDGFTKLTHSDRANSMPLSLPHGRQPTIMPSKPSLKRVSSFTSPTASDNSRGRRVGSKNSTSLQRNVSFSKLEIREYTIALSDHPSCSYGPPIQLGWKYRDRKAVELEDYEKKRSPRREMHQLVLSYNVRRYLLLKRAGYSKMELQHAMKEVERVKRDRLVTDFLLPASGIDEAFEEVFDNVKSIFFPPQTTAHHPECVF